MKKNKQNTKYMNSSSVKTLKVVTLKSHSLRNSGIGEKEVLKPIPFNVTSKILNSNLSM